MRWGDFRRSDNIEDRTDGDAGGGGFSGGGFPGGGIRLGGGALVCPVFRKGESSPLSLHTQSTQTLSLPQRESPGVLRRFSAIQL